MPSQYLVEVEYLLPKMAEQITKPEESDVQGVSLRVGHTTWFRSCVSKHSQYPPFISRGRRPGVPQGRLVFRHTISISDGKWGWGRWWATVSPTPTLVQAASFLSQSLLGSNSSVQVGGACLLLSPFHSTVMSLEAQATAGGKPGTGGA